MSRFERIVTEPAEGCTVEVRRRGLGWHWDAWGPIPEPVEGANFQWGRSGTFGWAWRRDTATWAAAWSTHSLARRAAQYDRRADLIARLEAAVGETDEASGELLRSAAAFLADRPVLAPVPTGEGTGE